VAHTPHHYPTAARITLELIERLQRAPLPRDTILNVNVPDVPYEAIRGIQVTRLGHRRTADAAIRSADPRGRAIWWVGAAGPEEDAGPGTDFHAVNHGYVSVTPLLVDLTQHSALDGLRLWIEA
jgi:5'-nucleotidase